MTSKIKGAQDVYYYGSETKSSWETPEEYLTGSVSGTTEDEIWLSPVVISVLNTGLMTKKQTQI